MTKRNAPDSAPEPSAQGSRDRTRALARTPIPTKDGARRRRSRSPESGRLRKRREKDTSHSAGSKTALTNHRRHLLAKTGMLPLDFLTAVFRDDLYDDYDRVPSQDGKTFYFVAAKTAKKIHVNLDQRLRAAEGAAPYVHRRMPQGIEVSDRQERLYTAEQLQRLPTKDLLLVMAIFSKLDEQGAPPSLKGAALMGSRTYTQDGREIRP